jgi:hypothetical protein
MTIKTRNNIVLPLCEQEVHGLTVVEDEEWPTLQEREFEQVLVDGSSCGDIFGWFYNREVPLALVDAETDIQDQLDELDELREFCLKNYYRDGKYLSSKKADRAIQRGIRLKAELEEYCHSVDMAYLAEEEDACDTLSPGAAMYNYLEMYIDRMSLPELAIAMDVLEDMHASKTISWYYYIQCGLAVCYRLAKRCPKGDWHSTLTNLRNHNHVNHTKVASYEDRYCGDMSFSMEAAIDLMDQARYIASHNHQDVEDTFYSIMEAQEADPTMWVPTLEEL